MGRVQRVPGPSAAVSSMQFKRKRIRGKTQKTYKEWRSNCGHYRVCWRNENPGLGSARYYATVRSDRGSVRDGSNEFWDFAADRRPYRTLKAAQKACEKNQRVWQKFIDLANVTRKGRLDRARHQIANSVVGTKPTASRILNSCPPVWAIPKLAPWLLNLVSPDHKEFRT